MKQFINTYWKTLLFFAVIGILGGFFTGIYVLDSYPADIKQQLIEELNVGGLDGLTADILMGIVKGFALFLLPLHPNFVETTYSFVVICVLATIAVIQEVHFTVKGQ